jgi:hypothetical protein
MAVGQDDLIAAASGEAPRCDERRVECDHDPRVAISPTRIVTTSS